ncbi:MAG: DUF2007 domain-containing protein [Nitrospirota bacterium]
MLKRFIKCTGKTNEKWVEVLITYDPIEVEIVKALLESGGIPVIIRTAKVRPYPVNLGKMGEIKVLVRKEDKEAAEKVIQGCKNGETLTK